MGDLRLGLMGMSGLGGELGVVDEVLLGQHQIIGVEQRAHEGDVGLRVGARDPLRQAGDVVAEGREFSILGRDWDCLGFV